MTLPLKRSKYYRKAIFSKLTSFHHQLMICALYLPETNAAQAFLSDPYIY